MNARRASEYLSRYELKGLIATSPVNVFYFTGFDCWLYRKYLENMLVLGAPRSPKEAFAVVAPGQEPGLVTDTYTCLFAEELEGTRVQGYGGEKPILPPASDSEPHHARFFRGVLEGQAGSPAEALVAALEAAGISEGRVGIETINLRPETRKALGRSLPKVELLDASELVGLIRMVKTDEEVSLLRTASKINEDGLFRSLENAHEGGAIRELSAAYFAEVAQMGAIFDHYFYSPDGLYLSDAPDYRLRKGEYTMIDSGCTYRMYYGDMGTSVLVGGGRKEVTRRFETVWNVIENLADRIGAGSTTSQIAKEFARAYEKAGVANPDYQGHGIGLEPREYPIVGQGRPGTIADDVVKLSTDLPLEEGMVISLETTLHEFGRGSYEVERTFEVGKRKLSEITSKRDRTMPTV